MDQFSPASDTASSSSDYPDNIPKGCVTYFSPGTLQTKFNSGAINCHYHFRFVSPPSSGHLNKSKVQRVECLNKAISYLTFSPDGNELLVNMGAEQIYLYDVIGGNKPVVSSNSIILHHMKCVWSKNINVIAVSRYTYARETPINR